LKKNEQLIVQFFNSFSDDLKDKIIGYVAMCFTGHILYRKVQIRSFKNGLLEISDGVHKHLVYPHEL